GRPAATESASPIRITSRPRSDARSRPIVPAGRPCSTSWWLRNVSKAVWSFLQDDNAFIRTTSRRHRPDRLHRQGYRARYARFHRALQSRALVRYRALRAEPGLLPRPADGYEPHIGRRLFRARDGRTDRA